MSPAPAADSVRPEYQLQKITGAAFAALLAGGGMARAADLAPWYVAAAVTGSDLDKPHQTIANAPAPGANLHVTNGVDFGWGGQLAVGRAIGPIRLEAEIGRTENKSGSYTATSPISITLPQAGHNNATRYMANAYYDVPLGKLPLVVYLGAGVGAADVRVSTFAAPARAPSAPRSTLMDFSRTVFAYQLMAGLSHPVSARLSLTAQYRWFDAGTIKGRDARGERATRDIAGHNLDLGLRYAF